jgi:tRNA-specific 2-thiouridylase
MFNWFKKKENTQGKKVYVGVSGGVDSSVTAALLQERGYDVTAVFIRVWQPDFLPCTQDDDRRDAKRVAASLGIPFRELDLSDEYKKEIVDTMVEGYKNGITPNPDVLCNRYIKFGGFLEWAKEEGADFVATGHYAQVVPYRKKTTEKFLLKRGVDDGKDQSYFLWMLTQDDLSHALMPVGEFQKSHTRELAEKYNLPTATKKDSQGLCFMGMVDMKEFLSHFIDFKSGDVLNSTGDVIGTHDGAGLYTIGQRHGFTIKNTDIKSKEQYVTATNIQENTITVGKREKTWRKEISLTKTNWIIAPKENKEYTAQLRYHGEKIPCTLTLTEKETRVTFASGVSVPSGQSCVVYDKENCLGGGIVI